MLKNKSAKKLLCGFIGSLLFFWAPVTIAIDEYRFCQVVSKKDFRKKLSSDIYKEMEEFVDFLKEKYLVDIDNDLATCALDIYGYFKKYQEYRDSIGKLRIDEKKLDMEIEKIMDYTYEECSRNYFKESRKPNSIIKENIAMKINPNFFSGEEKSDYPLDTSPVSPEFYYKFLLKFTENIAIGTPIRTDENLKNLFNYLSNFSILCMYRGRDFHLNVLGAIDEYYRDPMAISSNGQLKRDPISDIESIFVFFGYPVNTLKEWYSNSPTCVNLS